LGNFYTNFAVAGSDRSRVAAALRLRKRSAFLSPTINGTTMAYEEETECQDLAVMTRLGMELSGDLDRPVLAVLNHDDDILKYWLFRGAVLVDEYNSWPGCFTDGGGATPSGGSPGLLAEAFGIGAVAEIRSVLHEQDFAFAVHRHEALAKALGIDSCFAVLGYVDIRRGWLDQTILKQMEAV
jgi:hypothetical protein